ncbi:MAG: adenylate kinase [Candidatus Obscuribacterales bacterium]|nr:adenylate kinase [Candidatus Obscuribacterales bacterium]
MPQFVVVLAVVALVLVVESVLRARNYNGKKHNVIFMGAPGSGKGTQASHLAKDLNIPHLSSGDLLRKAVMEGSPTGEEIKSYIEKGQLAPDDLINKMIAQELSKPDYKNGFILDGYPRTVEQAEFLDNYLDEDNRYITAVIELQVDEEVLVERIAGRRICGNGQCNASYHLKFKPPLVPGTCDLCRRPLIQRADDTEAVLRERIERHEQRIVPLLQHYHHQGTLKEMKGEGPLEEIYDDILLSLGI